MIFYPPGTTATATWTDENGKCRRVRFIQEPNGRLVNKFTGEIPKNAKIMIHIEREAGGAIMMGDQIDYGQRWKIGQIGDVAEFLSISADRAVTQILAALAAGSLNNLTDTIGNEVTLEDVKTFLHCIFTHKYAETRVGVAISERLGWSK